MSDDFLAGGILPSDDVLVGIDDQNTKSSDDYLDDPLDTPIDELDIPLGLLDDDDDEMEDE
ncbi:MAG: hypothetical protein UY04_C0010G0012 [Parcubacteria group bacterium GW2011_GWA2_47_7]|nr:MAG: hypothetical protein UY04_C0010G0012 [Parcubacteria group bacterium GW2011_GWA2_47_7]